MQRDSETDVSSVRPSLDRLGNVGWVWFIKPGLGWGEGRGVKAGVSRCIIGGSVVFFLPEGKCYQTFNGSKKYLRKKNRYQLLLKELICTRCQISKTTQTQVKFPQYERIKVINPCRRALSPPPCKKQTHTLLIKFYLSRQLFLNCRED